MGVEGIKTRKRKYIPRQILSIKNRNEGFKAELRGIVA